ncbi:MAG: hypothetical protein WC788_05650 [Candidatus Paceibacterota bacterium]|jgi:hypothetical protein
MDAKNLRKIAIIAMLVFVLIGFTFFRKEKPKDSTPPDVPVIEDPVVVKPDLEKIEKENLQKQAEQFSWIYYSFSWGKFSNIESLYGEMTDPLREKERSKVESLKNGIKNQPVQYQTQRSAALSSEIVSYDKEKATVDVKLETSYYAGALVQRDTMVWVDTSGKEFKGNEFDLIYFKEQKTIELVLSKIDGKWKIDRVSVKQ